MPYLRDEQIDELSSDSLRDKVAVLTRGQSKGVYTLIRKHKHGMKGVVWYAKDDLGNDVAIKIVAAEDYSNRSLIDEMTEASKLGEDYFAAIKFFGDVSINGIDFSTNYKAIATKWIVGDAFDKFVNDNPLTVNDFLVLAQQLFTALATLRNNDLCHDDLHPGNVLIQAESDPLTREILLSIKIIDTGTIKRSMSREFLIKKLREKIEILNEVDTPPEELESLKAFCDWKNPDDHLRVIECLLYATNALGRNYYRLNFWERKFVDQLPKFFQRAVDPNLEIRLDSPETVLGELRALVRDSKAEDRLEKIGLSSPFDYISAEMIRDDTEFAELFSKECPWLQDCEGLEPIYVYGPRGCGKSSVLRWLAFKTVFIDPSRGISEELREIGVYVSCSVELRSRFWLLKEQEIDKFQTQIIRYFNLILLEELFDTLVLMSQLEESEIYQFGLSSSDLFEFTKWVIQRINPKEIPFRFRLQGQTYFEYLRGFVRKLRWETWSKIQNAQVEEILPDPSLVSDICRVLSDYFEYFRSRHISFLIDDYSNQRIPVHLQRKLNQTISFAKQGTPIFKVSSEYDGVDLEGIQEGREVIEVNIGEKYTSLADVSGYRFLADIVNIRLEKAGYRASIEDILGRTSYNGKTMACAIAEESEGRPFYYHGIDCIHWLCSGDVALALNVTKRIFDASSVGPDTSEKISPHAQHKIIQQFSHDEVRRIRYVVPYGEEMHDIICFLGILARAFVMGKRSTRQDKEGEPTCKTHVDIRAPVISELEISKSDLAKIYKLITSRAILFSLTTSRSRISHSVERLQMRRIYFPAFKSPLKRDVPIKIDSLEDLTSLLTNPKTFCQRELSKSAVDEKQFELALQTSVVQPRER